MAKSKKNVKKQEALYYFYSVGCGFCKKSEPIVDELNKEGYNILKLDLAEPDNQGLNNELKQKYGKQCGTPWLIDAESGNNICGLSIMIALSSNSASSSAILRPGCPGTANILAEAHIFSLLAH